jgi:putative oxidoreductase
MFHLRRSTSVLAGHRDTAYDAANSERDRAAHQQENNMNESVGKLILRLALGGLILLHGAAKLMGGIDFISSSVKAAGLPSFVAYGVYVGEVIAPLMVIIGWYSRLGAAIIAINMLFAIGLVHKTQLFALGQTGGWALELQGMFLFSAVALALLGPGRFSVNQK